MAARHICWIAGFQYDAFLSVGGAGRPRISHVPDLSVASTVPPAPEGGTCANGQPWRNARQSSGAAACATGGERLPRLVATCALDWLSGVPARAGALGSHIEVLWFGGRAQV